MFTQYHEGFQQQVGHGGLRHLLLSPQIVFATTIIFSSTRARQC
jgi:hypothetical protein